MKHVIFCTYPSIYSSIVLQEILASPHIHVDAVIASTVTKKKTRFPSFSIINTSGLRYAIYLWMVTTLFTWLPRKKLLSVSEIAESQQIPYFKSADINNAYTKNLFTEYPTSNLLLSAHFNQIIDTTLPTFEQRQCINIHPSLLPNNKGLDPVFYALLRKENQQGVTLHKITNAIDAGDIYAQQSMKAAPDNSLFMINSQLFSIGAKLLVQSIENETNATPQRNQGNYDSWPLRKDTRQVKNFINLREFFSAIY